MARTTPTAHADLPPAARAAPPLLATKLAPPLPQPDAIARPALVQRIERGLAYPITLVAAPAGFGKTTLLAQALRGQPGLAWVALDAGDNDPARFWAYLISALGQVFPSLAQRAPDLAQSAQALPATTLLAYLLNALAAAATPGVLVLDDYHVIESPAIHEALAYMVDHLPAQLRLVLGARAEPPLPLARWRASGALAELRADDLRFQPAEAAALLAAAVPAHAGQLPAPADLALLHARTEGWAAGLRLAALALAQAADPHALAASFGGGHAYLAGYLLDEVFARQPPLIQHFLLGTAMLDRLCGPLCDAVLGAEAGSAATLAQIERAGLFLSRLDGQGEWYRLHQLVAEFLRARLAQAAPQQPAEQHRRAMRWFEQAGLLDEALGHAFAAGDHPAAARLLAGSAPALLRRGEFITLRRHLSQLPEDLLWAQPRLGLARIWDWLDTNRLGEVLPSLARLDQLLASAGPELQAEALAVRAILAAMRHQPEQALALAQALERQPPGHDLFVQTYGAFSLGAAYKMGLRFELAAQQFRRASALAQAAGNSYLAFASYGNLGDVQYEQARLREAGQSNQQALALAAVAPGVERPMAGWIYWSQSRVAYQRDQLDEARAQIERCIELCAVWGNRAMHIRGHAVRAQVARAQADLAGAEASLAEAERLAYQLDEPQLLASVERQFTLLALDRGDLALARQLAERAAAPTSSTSAIQWAIVWARVRLAAGQPAQALELLRPAWQRYASSELVTLRIQLHVIEALARRGCGQPEQALAALDQALALAAPGGFVRVFLDEGAPMHELLRRSAPSSRAPHYVAALLRAFGQPAEAPLAEPLTVRERQILRALAAGLSNRDIAAELVIAESTLKRHVSNLYLKLGVHSRTQALARAAELRLL